VQLEREITKEALVVRASGELDVRTSPEFREVVDQWLLSTDRRRLILNLTKVQFLDSTGLGAILGRLRKAQELGREMALIPPSGVARTLVDTSALSRVMSVYRSERLALGEEAETSHG